eukprot:364331-Chlamydomonas_euryale.AAC.6
MTPSLSQRARQGFGLGPNWCSVHASARFRGPSNDQHCRPIEKACWYAEQTFCSLNARPASP